MNFNFKRVDFVMDFCVTFFLRTSWAFSPFKRRTENPQRNPQQNSRQNPCKIHACSEKRAFKWAVAKLQGDKAALICRKMSGREVTG